MLGASFMMGSGAAKVHDSLAGRIYAKLARAHFPRRVVLLNLAQSNASPSSQLKSFHLNWAFAANILLLDGHIWRGEAEVNDTLRLVREMSPGLKRIVIFSQEDPQVSSRHFPGLEKIFLSRLFSLSEAREYGFPNWDRVHLTSYGQRELGDRLGHELVKFLPGGMR